MTLLLLPQDVLDSKNSAIRDLQYELARVCKVGSPLSSTPHTPSHIPLPPQAHNDLIRTYEAKLTSFGVPTEELGFSPLRSTVGGQTLGSGPAGLVASPS